MAIIIDVHQQPGSRVSDTVTDDSLSVIADTEFILNHGVVRVGLLFQLIGVEEMPPVKNEEFVVEFMLTSKSDWHSLIEDMTAGTTSELAQFASTDFDSIEVGAEAAVGQIGCQPIYALRFLSKLNRVPMEPHVRNLEVGVGIAI